MAPIPPQPKRPTLWAYFRFVRFPMFVVPVLVFALGVIQSRGSWPRGVHDVTAIVAIVFMAAATFAYNGYEDRTIDANKGEPFALNYPRTALSISAALYVLGFAAACLVGGVFVLSFSLLLIATIMYSRFAVKVLVLKNVLAAFLSGVLVILGGAMSLGITRSNIITSCVIFFAILAMEVMNDIEDREADRDARKTLPHVVSMPALRWIIWLLVLLAGTLGSFVPHHSALFALMYVLALVAFLLAALSLPKHLPDRVRHIPRVFLYAGLWFGLAAFAAAALER